MGAAPPFPGEGARRRRGLGCWKGGGDLDGPLGALGSQGGGQRWRLHGGRRPAVVRRRTGGVPASSRRRDRVE